TFLGRRRTAPLKRQRCSRPVFIRAETFRDGSPLLWNCGRASGHQLVKAGVLSYGDELRIFIDVVYIFVALFHGLAQVLEGALVDTQTGIHFGDDVIVVRTVLG